MMLDADSESEIMEGVELLKRTPRLMQILDAVCTVYRVGKLDIMSQRKFSNIVTARDAFYWCAYRFTARTYAEIGRFLGDRDHSSIIAGVSRINTKFCRHRDTLAKVAKHLELDPSIVPPNAYGKNTKRK